MRTVVGNTVGSHGSLSMQLVSADSLRNLLEGLGVSDKSTIVLYSTSQSMSPVARAYVTLDYLGLGTRTHILNGGYDAWKAAGGAVDIAAPRIVRGSLHVNTYHDAVTDGAYVKARARFAAAGVPLDKPVIVYCHIGQTASVDYVQLRRLGVPVRLYDGSFEDWSRHSNYPVVTGVGQ